MPTHQYTEKLRIYECIQYDGTNYDEIVTFAPVTKKDGKVYLETSLGSEEVLLDNWIMRDVNWNSFVTTNDESFQKGYKPGGGPV